jgi:hypothetical protein
MSTVKTHHPANVTERGRRRRAVLAAAAALAVAAGIAIGIGVTATSDDGDERAAPAPRAHGSDELPAGYRLTGQIGPMGGRVLETPGTRSGVASAGGVIVVDGADIVMGHIPLAYAVNPTWRLRNTSDQTVRLGAPTVAVIRGCCPAEPILGTAELGPGEETTLQFPTQMHPGMDGDHLFRLTVPVGATGDPIVVSVAGDFS